MYGEAEWTSEPIHLKITSVYSNFLFGIAVVRTGLNFELPKYGELEHAFITSNAFAAC